MQTFGCIRFNCPLFALALTTLLAVGILTPQFALGDDPLREFRIKMDVLFRLLNGNQLENKSVEFKQLLDKIYEEGKEDIDEKRIYEELTGKMFEAYGKLAEHYEKSGSNSVISDFKQKIDVEGKKNGSRKSLILLQRFLIVVEKTTKELNLNDDSNKIALSLLYFLWKETQKMHEYSQKESIVQSAVPRRILKFLVHHLIGRFEKVLLSEAIQIGKEEFVKAVVQIIFMSVRFGETDMGQLIKVGHAFTFHPRSIKQENYCEMSAVVEDMVDVIHKAITVRGMRTDDILEKISANLGQFESKELSKILAESKEQSIKYSNQQIGEEARVFQFLATIYSNLNTFCESECEHLDWLSTLAEQMKELAKYNGKLDLQTKTQRTVEFYILTFLPEQFSHSNDLNQIKAKIVKQQINQSGEMIIRLLNNSIITPNYKLDFVIDEFRRELEKLVKFYKYSDLPPLNVDGIIEESNTKIIQELITGLENDMSKFVEKHNRELHYSSERENVTEGVRKTIFFCFFFCILAEQNGGGDQKNWLYGLLKIFKEKIVLSSSFRRYSESIKKFLVKKIDETTKQTDKRCLKKIGTFCSNQKLIEKLKQQQ